MSDLIEKAVNAKRESKRIEFKRAFNPTSEGEWCEIMKDIAALGNSGGGVIVFGLNSDGRPVETPCEAISKVDPADISNKITKYTGFVDPQVEIREVSKQGRQFPALIIHPVSIPMLFVRPGTYDVGGGKQKTAFSQGTVYFRHGAKSEPGTAEDIRLFLERQLEKIRKSWIKNVRRVVEAEPGSQVLVRSVPGYADLRQSNAVRVVNHPSAIPVALTRDPNKAEGTFMHETVSDGIFDEINNVVDANRALAKGRQRFFLGAEVYYRLYAERRSVRQDIDQIELLFHSALSEFYAPCLFWVRELDTDNIARNVATLYLEPKNPQIYALMRMAVLLGRDFCQWLRERWDRKWGNYSQPPAFYHTFDGIIEKIRDSDPRLIAARSSAAARVSLPGQDEVSYSELLDAPQRAESLLSAACTAVFDGNKALKTTARDLDYIAHGLTVMQRAKDVAKAVKKAVGNQQVGDIKESKLT